MEREEYGTATTPSESIVIETLVVWYFIVLGLASSSLSVRFSHFINPRTATKQDEERDEQKKEIK